MYNILHFKKFNESTNNDCSFDTFKDIMTDISDDFECDFYDHSDQDEGFYDCMIKLPQLDYIDDVSVSYGYLDDVMSPYDSPDEVDYLSIYEQISNYNSKMLDFKRNIDTVISNNEKVKQIFITIETMIVPRLKSFSNCLNCSIGFDVDSIRLCFDIKTM